MAKKLTKKAFTSGFAKNSYLGSSFPQMRSGSARMMQTRFGVDIAGQQAGLKNKKTKGFSFKTL